MFNRKVHSKSGPTHIGWSSTGPGISIVIFLLISHLLFCSVLFADEQVVAQLDIIRSRQKELLFIIRSYQEKSFAGFMLAIGWLVTSKDARKYLSDQRLVRNIILLAVLMLFIVTQITLVDFYISSEQLFRMLTNTDIVFEDPSDIHATTYRFKLSNLIVSALFFFILYLVLSALIYWQKTDSNSETPP